MTLLAQCCIFVLSRRNAGVIFDSEDSNDAPVGRQHRSGGGHASWRRTGSNQNLPNRVSDPNPLSPTRHQPVSSRLLVLSNGLTSPRATASSFRTTEWRTCCCTSLVC